MFFDGLDAGFTACVRYAYGLRKRQSISDNANKILGYVFQYLRYHILNFVHNVVLKSILPKFHSKLFRSSDRTFNFNIPQTSSSRTYDSLFVSGISTIRYLFFRSDESIFGYVYP